MEIRNEAFANDGATPGSGDYDLIGSWGNTPKTDWQDVLIGGTAEITNIDAIISGGNTHTILIRRGIL